MAYLYAKTSGTGIVLLSLMYIANSKRFVSSDLIAPSSRGERSTHSTPSRNEIRIVQLKLPHASTWEVSQKQHCPPRSLLTKRQRAGALKSAYWKTVTRSHFDSIVYSGGYMLRKRLEFRDKWNRIRYTYIAGSCEWTCSMWWLRQAPCWLNGSQWGLAQPYQSTPRATKATHLCTRPRSKFSPPLNKRTSKLLKVDTRCAQQRT